MLYRLLYRSACVVPESALDAELEAIRVACERNNPADNVTGALIHYDGEFAQLIEGGRAAVSRTLKRLMNDPRHANVELIAMGETHKREFAQFSMLIAKIDGWFAAEMAEFTVADRFRLGDLTADGLAAFMVLIDKNLQVRQRAAIEATAARAR